MNGRRTLRRQLLTVMAVAATAAASTGAAFAHDTGAISAYSGSTLVGSGSASLFHGYSALAGSNMHSGVFTVTDRHSTDSRSVYGELVGHRYEVVWIPRPGGGRSPSPRWIGEGTAQTSRTSSSLTEGISVRGSANPTGIWRTYAKVCRDVPLAPDNCGTYLYG